MSIKWPDPGSRQQSLLHLALLLVAGALMLAWVILPAIADWYGSLGAAKPNIRTGQTALIKGIHAVGYGSEQDAFWFKSLPLMIFLMLLITGWACERSGYRQARTAAGKRITFHPLFWVIWFAVLAGGGHWIALLFTGSWQFPLHSN